MKNQKFNDSNIKISYMLPIFFLITVCCGSLFASSKSESDFVIRNPHRISVDWASFDYQDNLALVEIYYSLPYNTLHYVATNDTIIAQYCLSFFLTSLSSPESLSDTTYHRALIPSFQKAHDQDMKLVDGFGFFARSGDYWFSLTITDAGLTSTIIDTITVPDFSLEPVLSNIELASKVTRDTSGGKFTKGQMRIIPNPDLKFGLAYEYMYVYVEGYNLINDTASYELTYQILASNNTIVKSYAPEKKKKSGSNFAYTFALNTQGLPIGTYFLELKLTDLSTGKFFIRTKPFSVITKSTEPVITSRYKESIDTSVYYTEIRFYATATELSQYHNLNVEGKKEFLRRFWLKRDFNEFIKRISYSDEKYRIGKVLGRESDRGRIYIKYGAPDEIIVHSTIEQVKPHEHWYYYARGIHFIFIDIRSNNSYPLIYSNINDEPKHPNWEKYVDPLEIDELRE